MKSGVQISVIRISEGIFYWTYISTAVVDDGIHYFPDGDALRLRTGEIVQFLPQAYQGEKVLQESDPPGHHCIVSGGEVSWIWQEGEL